MEATAAPKRRISVGDVVNETFSIFGQHFVPLSPPDSTPPPSA